MSLNNRPISINTSIPIKQVLEHTQYNAVKCNPAFIYTVSSDMNCQLQLTILQKEAFEYIPQTTLEEKCSSFTSVLKLGIDNNLCSWKGKAQGMRKFQMLNEPIPCMPLEFDPFPCVALKFYTSLECHCLKFTLPSMPLPSIPYLNVTVPSVVAVKVSLKCHHCPSLHWLDWPTHRRSNSPRGNQSSIWIPILALFGLIPSKLMGSSSWLHIVLITSTFL